MTTRRYAYALNGALIYSVNMSHQTLPQIAAHRGLAWRYPANTMIAFEAAAACHPDYIELDFHSTSDGQIICVHDRTLDRYVKDTQPELVGVPVSAMTLQKLLTIDVGCDTGPGAKDTFKNTMMPTLESVLRRFVCENDSAYLANRSKLMIEHKSGPALHLFELLKKVDVNMDRVVVMSFDWTYLADLRRLSGDVSLALLGNGEVTAASIQTAIDLHAVAMHWNTTLTTDAIAMIHAAKLQAWMYTLNHELQWRGGVQMGLDVITTDRCDDLAKMLAKL